MAKNRIDRPFGRLPSYDGKVIVRLRRRLILDIFFPYLIFYIKIKVLRPSIESALLSGRSGTACNLYPTEGFSYFVTSMTAPVTSGWSKIAGWDSHPLRRAAFARRTSFLDIRSHIDDTENQCILSAPYYMLCDISHN